MDVLEAIRSRRSMGKVKKDDVDPQLIETLLEAAVWAPNHHRTEPWRFFVFTGEGRRKLADVFAEIARENMEDPSAEENQKVIEREMAKPYRAPVIIAAAVSPSDDPRVIASEEKAAVGAAVQNMLLAAESLGLGAIWRTGKPAYHPKVKELLQLTGNDELLGFIYIGYPDMSKPAGKRISYLEKTKWIRG